MDTETQSRMTYEEYRARQVVDALRANPRIAPLTHGHVINTLEAYKLATVASWYWQHAGLQGPDDLEKPA